MLRFCDEDKRGMPGRLSITVSPGGDVYVSRALARLWPADATHAQLGYDNATGLTVIIPAAAETKGGRKVSRGGKRGIEIAFAVALDFFSLTPQEKIVLPAAWRNSRIEAPWPQGDIVDSDGIETTGPAGGANAPTTNIIQRKSVAVEVAHRKREDLADVTVAYDVFAETSKEIAAEENAPRKPGSPCCLNCKDYKSLIGIEDRVCQSEASPFKGQPTAARHLCKSYRPWKTADGALPAQPPRVTHCSTEPQRKWGPNDPRRGKRPRVKCAVCRHKFATRAAGDNPLPHDRDGIAYTGRRGDREHPCEGNLLRGTPVEETT